MIHLRKEQRENAAEEQRPEQQIDAKEPRAENADAAQNYETDSDVIPGMTKAKASYRETQYDCERDYASGCDQGIRSHQIVGR